MILFAVFTVTTMAALTQAGPIDWPSNPPARQRQLAVLGQYGSQADLVPVMNIDDNAVPDAVIPNWALHYQPYNTIENMDADELVDKKNSVNFTPLMYQLMLRMHLLPNRYSTELRSRYKREDENLWMKAGRIPKMGR